MCVAPECFEDTNMQDLPSLRKKGALHPHGRGYGGGLRKLLKEVALGRLEGATVDRVLAHLQLLRDSYPGNQIDRYQHSLQIRHPRRERRRNALRSSWRGVLHDIGDTISLYNHEEIMAAQVFISPYVSQYNLGWMLRRTRASSMGYYYFDTDRTSNKGRARAVSRSMADLRDDTTRLA